MKKISELDELTGKGIKIAVIDSGVQESHPALINYEINQYIITGEDGSYNVENGGNDLNGHGTAVVSLILNSLRDTQIYSFQIYQEELVSESEKLIRALTYIHDNLDCQLVHLSLGIRVECPALYDICKKLYDRGAIILAAFDNEGCISFPAAYPFVIGVDGSRKLRVIDNFIYVRNSMVNILAKLGNQRLAWKNSQYIINQGTSFILPYVTSLAGKLLCSGISKNNLLEEIEKRAVEVYQAPVSHEIYNPLSPLKFCEAYIFPYNKETHSLLNFMDLLTFKPVGFLDIKQSLNIGKKVESLDKKHTLKIDNIDSFSPVPGAGLIIGHTAQMEKSTGRPLKDELLNLCLEKLMHVYMFDDDKYIDYCDKFSSKGLVLSCPAQNPAYGLMDRFGMLYKHKTPILGVFGTTSKQGKFSLQLELRRRFISDGYKVAQIGTEPQSYLFGIDATYHYGYSGTAKIGGAQAIQYINQTVHELDKIEPDIIILGGQSGTIPQYTNNLGQIPLQTLNFILGSSPDAVILCVNSFDDIEYIKRTITIIENLTGDIKVIALCLFPLDMQNGWQIMNQHKTSLKAGTLAETKKMLEEHMNLPVFTNGTTEDMAVLYELCLKFFDTGG